MRRLKGKELKRHTSGPWRNDAGTIFAGDIPVAGIIWDVTTPQQQPYNAALIAAAPEMHSLLVEAATTIDTTLDMGDLTKPLHNLKTRLEALLARLEEK